MVPARARKLIIESGSAFDARKGDPGGAGVPQLIVFNTITVKI